MDNSKFLFSIKTLSEETRKAKRISHCIEITLGGDEKLVTAQELTNIFVKSGFFFEKIDHNDNQSSPTIRLNLKNDISEENLDVAIEILKQCDLPITDLRIGLLCCLVSMIMERKNSY